MIRSLIIASAIALGTVSAQAAGIESAANQANVLEGFAGNHVAAAMIHEGRAAASSQAAALPAWFYDRDNESPVGN